MGKTTGIEWADATWNPWMGCTQVSAGCANCYMFREQRRFGHDPTVIRRSKTTFEDPLKWKEPRRIFVCSWSDFFHPEVPGEWRLEALEIMKCAPRHTYMILTKRPEEGRHLVPDEFWRANPNIWLGISAETQYDYEDRLPFLLTYPALVRFISIEPMLGPICLALENLTGMLGIAPFDWVIVGGESGPNARPMKPEWVYDIRDQCVEAGVPFFFKQWGGTSKVDGAWGGRLLDGRTWDELPRAFRPVEEW